MRVAGTVGGTVAAACQQGAPLAAGQAVDRLVVYEGDAESLPEPAVAVERVQAAAAVGFDRLLHAGVVSLSRLIELLSLNPARILRVPGGSLADGAPADVSILAPDMAVTVSAARMRSKSKNTPFDGWTLRGGVAATIVGGRTVYVNEDAGFRLLTFGFS